MILNQTVVQSPRHNHSFQISYIEALYIMKKKKDSQLSFSVIPDGEQGTIRSAYPKTKNKKTPQLWQSPMFSQDGSKGNVLLWWTGLCYTRQASDSSVSHTPWEKDEKEEGRTHCVPLTLKLFLRRPAWCLSHFKSLMHWLCTGLFKQQPSMTIFQRPLQPQ